MSFASIEHKMSFFHIPRAGGTSISRSILMGENERLWKYNTKSGVRPNTWTRTGFYTIESYYNEFRRLPEWSFAVVRNPYERCLSIWAYNDHGQDDLTSKKDRWKIFLNNCGYWTQTYEKAPSSFRSIPHHILPAHCFVSIKNKTAVNALIKMENINLIPQIVWDNTRIDLKISKLPRLNKSNSADFVDAFMDEESMEHIRNIYTKDFQLYRKAI
tara:strand:+ start:51792 stop:52436 length:645 start_codon:yes stop_codon:yes gene_type:complete